MLCAAPPQAREAQNESTGTAYWAPGREFLGRSCATNSARPGAKLAGEREDSTSPTTPTRRGKWCSTALNFGDRKLPRLGHFDRLHLTFVSVPSKSPCLKRLQILGRVLGLFITIKPHLLPTEPVHKLVIFSNRGICKFVIFVTVKQGREPNRGS
jgi:hypothetical protein